MADRIPLFPLGSTVLFPGALLPLHIFEQRYRDLVRDLLALPEEAPRRFGVVAIREGWEVGGSAALRSLYRVGCTAQVRRIKPHPDGRYDLIGVGTQRFELLAVDTESRPYLTGTVRWLAAEERESPAAVARARGLAVRAGALFDRYADAVATLQGGEYDASDLPEDPVELSYLLAGAAMLGLADRQSLLTESSTAARLDLLCGLLRRESLFVHELRALPVPLIELTVPRSAN